MHRVLPGIVAGGFVVLAAAMFLSSPALAACGEASWYGPAHHGRTTASGERFDQWAMTAARPSRRDLGKVYRVTYRGRSVRVRINDTGGFARYGRIIDLSRGAARKLGMERAGVGSVCIAQE